MRDINRLVKDLRKKGYLVRQGGRTANHWKVYDNDGRLISTFACTISDHKAIHSIRQYLKKAGVDL